MEKEILHTHAEDENGNIVHINDAEKGLKYYCPDYSCKKEFVLKKSGKAGKGSKRPHFAYKKGSNHTCTHDTYLHDTFQKSLICLLEKSKAADKEFSINWSCGICNHKNTGNLLKKAASIKREYFLKECRPDIALLDKEGSVLAAVELVNTHEPEEKPLRYYKDNKITLVQINLSSLDDLMKVEEKAKNPDIVDFCANPKCRNHGACVKSRRIHVEPVQCKSCGAQVESYHIEVENLFGEFKSSILQYEDINLLKSKGHNIKVWIDKDTKERFFSAVCISCKRNQISYVPRSWYPKRNFRL